MSACVGWFPFDPDEVRVWGVPLGDPEEGRVCDVVEPFDPEAMERELGIGAIRRSPNKSRIFSPVEEYCEASVSCAPGPPTSSWQMRVGTKETIASLRSPRVVPS